MIHGIREIEDVKDYYNNAEIKKTESISLLPVSHIISSSLSIKRGKYKTLIIPIRTRNQHRCACYLRGNSTRNRGQQS